MGKAIYVIATQKKPVRLHRTDCWHPKVGWPAKRASAVQLRTLKVCEDCAPKS